MFLPLGVALIGVGNATNMATRHAAADLVKPERRASTIGLVVAATTIGSGFGSLVSLSVFDPLGADLDSPITQVPSLSAPYSSLQRRRLWRFDYGQIPW